MNRKSDRRSAFLTSRLFVSLITCAIGSLGALLLFALHPGGNVQAQRQVQTPTQDQMSSFVASPSNIPDGVMENAVRCEARVTSITETPLSPYDHAVMTGQNPLPLSPVVAGDPNHARGTAPNQATPTVTPSGAMVLLDTFTGKTAFSFVNSTFRAYMGDGFTNNLLPGGTTYTNIRSYTAYITAATVANYNSVHARMVLWNNYVAANSPVFTNSAALFDVDLGALNVTAAPVFFSANVEALAPYPFLIGGAGTQWGYVNNFRGCTTGAGCTPIDTQNLTSLVPNGGAYAAGTIITGTSPNFAWYMNNNTAFNFTPTVDGPFAFAGRTNQGVGIIIRGDPQTGPTPTPAPTLTPSPSPTPSPTPTTPTPTPVPTASPTPTPSSTPSVTPPPTVCSFAESMDDITNLGSPKGWYMSNQSSLPVGFTSWFQGSTGVFCAQSGACKAYIGANYQNTGGTTGSEIISNWLITPPVTIQSGAFFVFWTRTVTKPAFPDRLQVRFSTNGTSTNVGGTPTSVGDFTNLLLDINPTYQTTGSGAYPNVWTQFVCTVTGIGLPITGRIAFRYFVESGGPAGLNSDYIGIDTISYLCKDHTPTPPPTPTPTPPTPPTPTPCPPDPSPDPCRFMLYDQSVPGTGTNVASQDFDTPRDLFDCQAADDFVIPPDWTWTIKQVYATGVYFNGTGRMPFVNLYFYADSGGFPGAAIATYLNTPLACDLSGSIIVTIPGGALFLGPGTYWVSLQARMDFPTGGQWGWGDRTTTSNNAAVWQNPGGGFATGCTTWGRRGAICEIDSAHPDQLFALAGCATTATPSPIPLTISGGVGNCASPAPTATPPASPTPPTLPAVPNVLMTLSGSSSGTTLTDGSGNYSFNVVAGGTYVVTPSKGPLAPGSAGINTTDVLAVQRHFLGITVIPVGCRLTAADAVINGTINTSDVIAIQRFFLGLTSSIGSTGQYKFTPASRSYPSISVNQTQQDYSMYVVGDVASPFNNRPRNESPGPL